MVVRWNTVIGVAQRTISSAAVSGRDALNSSHWSGWSRKASIPCAMALRVVSLPATASISTKKPNSSSDRWLPSISALISLVTMSSRGHPRRSSAMARL